MGNRKIECPPCQRRLQTAFGQLWNGFHTKHGLVCQRETPPNIPRIPLRFIRATNAPGLTTNGKPAAVYRSHAPAWERQKS